jgi:hypothetical protein
MRVLGVRSRRCLERSEYTVWCCTAVLRLRMCVVACALLHRVSLWLVCDCAALRGIVSAVDCVCVSLRCVHGCVTAALQCVSGAALHVCCRRRRSIAAHVAHYTCPVNVHVAVAVSRCCNVRAGSDSNTVVEVLYMPPGVAALDAAAWCCGWVCNVVPPLCVTTVLTSMLSVQCSGVCSCGVCGWMSVCRLLFDECEPQCWSR